MVILVLLSYYSFQQPDTERSVILYLSRGVIWNFFELNSDLRMQPVRSLAVM